MAGFDLLADVFLAQLKTVPSCRTHGCNVMYSIRESSSYKPIYKLLNANLQFQAYIGIVTQNIIKQEILKLILNITLKLSSRAIDPSQIKSLNKVAINKEYQRNVLFFWSLFCVIVNSSNADISKNSNNSDKELPKLADNMYRDSFLLLEEKTSYCCNRETIAVAIIYMPCYACNEHLNFF